MPHIATWLAIVLLWLQIRKADQQFIVLNQGFLSANPAFSFSNDDLPGTLAIAENTFISPDQQFQAISPFVEIENVGNLPLKYNVLRYEVLINGEVYNKPFGPDDRTEGILYPKTKATFTLPALYFDKIQHRTLKFQEIQKLALKGSIKIQYYTVSNDVKYVDRTFKWLVTGNQIRLTWDQFSDKW